MGTKNKTLSYTIDKETNTEFKRICNILSIESSNVAQHLFKKIIANNNYEVVTLSKAKRHIEESICSSIRVNSELMKFPHRVNVNATFARYVTDFIRDNKNCKITDIAVMPELKLIYIKDYK